jgi:hypothetical protein
MGLSLFVVVYPPRSLCKMSRTARKKNDRVLHAQIAKRKHSLDSFASAGLPAEQQWLGRVYWGNAPPLRPLLPDARSPPRA